MTDHERQIRHAGATWLRAAILAAAMIFALLFGMASESAWTQANAARIAAGR